MSKTSCTASKYQQLFSLPIQNRTVIVGEAKDIFRKEYQAWFTSRYPAHAPLPASRNILTEKITEMKNAIWDWALIADIKMTISQPDAAMRLIERISEKGKAVARAQASSTITVKERLQIGLAIMTTPAFVIFYELRATLTIGKVI